jgi:hypothetical protein
MYPPQQPANYGPQHHVPPAWPSPAAPQPVFQVHVMKHTGALMLWLNQGYTVTGTYGQCDVVIRAAQQHNLLAGWWSPMSVLALNWIALFTNMSARKMLQHNAARAYGVIGYTPQASLHPGVPSSAPSAYDSPWGPPPPPLKAL